MTVASPSLHPPGFSQRQQPGTDLSGLPPFLRALVVADGTVVKLLEAFFWEPVSVRVLARRVVREPFFETGDGPHEVLHRDVVLESARFNRVFAWASSLIALDLLEPDLRAEMEAGVKGVGALLREDRVETFRTVMNIELGSVDELAEIVGHPSDTAMVSRTYSIRRGGRTLMQIEERFPVESYRDITDLR